MTLWVVRCNDLLGGVYLVKVSFMLKENRL